jgi:hypothetical protein
MAGCCCCCLLTAIVFALHCKVLHSLLGLHATLTASKLSSIWCAAACYCTGCKFLSAVLRQTLRCN